MKTTDVILKSGIIALFILPASVLADSWSCSSGNDVREVHIERTSTAAVPCNVVYKKLTEGAEDQVLWNANHDQTFCSDKAQGLVTKLESAGWVCTETISEASETEAPDN